MLLMIFHMLAELVLRYLVVATNLAIYLFIHYNTFTDSNFTQWFLLSNLSPNIYMSARKSCLRYRSCHNYEKSSKLFKFATCHWILGISVYIDRIYSKVNQLISQVANSPARSVSPPSTGSIPIVAICPNSAFLLSLSSFLHI